MGVGSGSGFVGSGKDEIENKKKILKKYYFNEVVKNIKPLILGIL